MKIIVTHIKISKNTCKNVLNSYKWLLAFLLFLFGYQLQAQTSNGREDKLNEVEILIKRGDSLYTEGQFDKAIPLYRQAILYSPYNLHPYEPLIYSYSKLGLFDEAKKWLLEKQKYSKDRAMDQCLFADLAVRRGDIEAARIHKDSLIGLAGPDPSWSLLACTAEIEVHLGEYKKARGRIERAVAELRRKGEPLHGLSFLAFLKLQEGDTARAKELLAEHEALAKKKLSEDKHIAVSHFDLAAIAAVRGRADAAVDHLREGLGQGGWGQYWGGYYYIMADPIFKSLHKDPEFEQFMAEIKERVDHMRKRVMQNAPAHKNIEAAGNTAYIVNIEALDHDFILPSEIPSGWITFRFKNKGEGMHLAMLGRKPDTLSKKDFLKAINEGIWPPFEYAGGPGIHSPGTVSETAVYMEPGDYFVGCGANTAEGKNHSALGMVKYLKVTEEPSGATEPIADAVLILDEFEINGNLTGLSGHKTIKIVHNAHPMDVHFIRQTGESTIPRAISYFHELKDPPPVKLLGGVEQAETGNVSYLTLDFKPGEYVWMSHEYGAWGMHLPISIQDNGRVIERTEEEEDIVNDVTIKVGNNDLVIDEKIAMGKTKLFFKFTGEEEHDIEINRLKPEATKQEALEWYDAWTDDSIDNIEEYPFLGFWITVDRAKETGIILGLIPDKYFIHCLSTDEEGIGHWNKGEAAVFTVPEEKVRE